MITDSDTEPVVDVAADPAGPSVDAAAGPTDDAAAGGATGRGGRLQRIVRWTALIAAVLAVVVGTAAWLVYGSPFLDVQKVRVSGQGQIPAEQITTAANLEMGSPLIAVDTAEVEELVRALPQVRRATVTRQWPHTVAVQVTPRTPVAVAAKGSAFEIIDGEGVTLGEVAKAPANVPLLRSGQGDERKALAAALDPMAPQVRAKIAQAAIVNGEIRMSLVDGGGTVVWGTATDAELKAKVLGALLTAGGTATWFDISVPGSPSTSEGQPVRPGAAKASAATDPFFGGSATAPTSTASTSPAPAAPAATAPVSGAEAPATPAGSTETGGAGAASPESGATSPAGAPAGAGEVPVGGGEQAVGLR